MTTEELVIELTNKVHSMGLHLILVIQDESILSTGHICNDISITTSAATIVALQKHIEKLSLNLN